MKNSSERIDQGDEAQRASFKALQAAMRLTNDNAAAGGPLRLVDAAEDASRLQFLLKSEQGPPNITLATGLGLSAEGIPLRLPAVLLPGLEILRKYATFGIQPPKYLIYQATQFIAETNVLAQDTAVQIAEVMTRYIDRFVTEAYPDIAGRVELRFGEHARVDADHLLAIEQELAALPAAQPDLLRLQEANARQRRDVRMATRYAAANVLLNGACPGSPFEDVFGSAAAVMPIGGRQEEPFFRLTRLMAQQHGRVVIPQLCQPGEAPTYYPHSQGDLLVGRDDSSRAPGFAGVRRDYQLLESIGFPVSRLRSLSYS